MTLVAGVESSTRSCKVVVRDAGTGALVREGRAPYPSGNRAPHRAGRAGRTGLGVPVLVPPPEEDVAEAAARQAAWAPSGSDAPPRWSPPGTEVFEADPVTRARERYAEVCDLTAAGG